MKKSPAYIAFLAVCAMGATASVFAADPPSQPVPNVAVEPAAKPAVVPPAEATAAKDGKCDMSGDCCSGKKGKHARKSHKMKKSEEPKTS